jgi:hypothetical protein
MRTSGAANAYSGCRKPARCATTLRPPVVVYLVSSIGYGLIASDEVIPEDHKVPFDEALRGLGLLLDRGLAPTHIKGRNAARALVVAMVEKMQAALRELDTTGAENHRAA